MPELLTDNERVALTAIEERARHLTEYLGKATVPSPASPLSDWMDFLVKMKTIVGNSDNDVSLVASLMARQWLCGRLAMRPYDAASKSQNAPGLDIDEMTVDGHRVVGEIKTTEPYQKTDFGSAQIDSIRKDFAKLNAVAAEHRFFFVTTRRAFEVVKSKYADEIPMVTTALLPTGETFRAGAAPVLAPSQPKATATRPQQVAASSVIASGVSGRVFPLVLHKTYLEQGFFNLSVDFDRYVRADAGPISIVLSAGGRETQVEAKVNRTANKTGTARIMGGTALRDWFMRHFDLGVRLDVQLLSPTEIRIEKAKL